MTFQPATYLACKRCPTGAMHAGQTSINTSPLRDSTICARCHKDGRRLVRNMICVSCYNREREVVRGRNSKGTKPTKHAALAPRRIEYFHGDELVEFSVARSLNLEELMIQILRTAKKEVIFAFRPPPRPDGFDEAA